MVVVELATLMGVVLRGGGDGVMELSRYSCGDDDGGMC
jgi:hypothetical protein